MTAVSSQQHSHSCKVRHLLRDTNFEISQELLPCEEDFDPYAESDTENLNEDEINQALEEEEAELGPFRYTHSMMSKCPWCPASFTWARLLTEHIDQHHAQQDRSTV